MWPFKKKKEQGECGCFDPDFIYGRKLTAEDLKQDPEFIDFTFVTEKNFREKVYIYLNGDEMNIDNYIGYVNISRSYLEACKNCGTCLNAYKRLTDRVWKEINDYKMVKEICGR